MKGHTIRWNGMKIKYSQGDDLKALLNTAESQLKIKNIWKFRFRMMKSSYKIFSFLILF